MNLIIDTGNTQTKIGIFDSNAVLISTEIVKNITPENINQILEKYNIKNSIHSFVANRDCETVEILKKKCNHIIFSHNTPLPITLNYKTPETLGLDRIAGVIGANTIFPENNVLVVDAGSAITFDIITNDKVFLGGNISPGINMRYKALNTFTNKLPLLEINETFQTLGQTTKDAIVSGVQYGILAEVEAYITQFEEKFSNLKVIITGGDTFFFERNLKKLIFAEPFLVLKGLNRIIEYNV